MHPNCCCTRQSRHGTIRFQGQQQKIYAAASRFTAQKSGSAHVCATASSNSLHNLRLGAAILGSKLHCAPGSLARHTPVGTAPPTRRRHRSDGERYKRNTHHNDAHGPRADTYTRRAPPLGFIRLHLRHRYPRSHLSVVRPPTAESPRPGSGARSKRSQKRRLRALVGRDRERSQKYVTMAT